MNREIKFRAWNGKEMHYHGMFAFGASADPLRGTQRTYELYPFEGIESGEMITGEMLPDCVFMQYTGLKDKNGGEIYAGDILQSSFGRNYIVEMIDDGWKYRSLSESGGAPLYGKVAANHSIIGNIYANPELFAS